MSNVNECMSTYNTNLASGEHTRNLPNAFFVKAQSYDNRST